MKKLLVLLLICAVLMCACQALPGLDVRPEAASASPSKAGAPSRAGSSLSAGSSSRAGTASAVESVPEEEAIDAFAACGNYHPERRAEYEAYQAEHPELTVPQAVTFVNIGLNRPFYTGIEEIEDPNSILVLCNKYHALPEGYAPEDLIQLSARNSVSGRTVTLRKEAAEAFEALCDAARQEGYTILGQSGYRSYSYQQTLYTNYAAADGQAAADTYSARPGHSEHQTGLAIDVRNADRIYTDFGQTAEYQWAKENLHKYGFILRYLPEKQSITGYKTEEWHFRYVGKETAEILWKTGLTFDEYCAMEELPQSADAGELLQ